MGRDRGSRLRQIQYKSSSMFQSSFQEALAVACFQERCWKVDMILLRATIL